MLLKRRRSSSERWYCDPERSPPIFSANSLKGITAMWAPPPVGGLDCCSHDNALAERDPVCALYKCTYCCIGSGVGLAGTDLIHGWDTDVDHSNNFILRRLESSVVVCQRASRLVGEARLGLLVKFSSLFCQTLSF